MGKPLTLQECLNQPNGTEGRLFEENGEDNPNSLLMKHGVVGAYEVLSIENNHLKIRAYTYSGSTKVIESIPQEERYKDVALSSEKLMNFYVQLGIEIKARDRRAGIPA